MIKELGEPLFSASIPMVRAVNELIRAHNKMELAATVLPEAGTANSESTPCDHVGARLCGKCDIYHCDKCGVDFT